MAEKLKPMEAIRAYCTQCLGMKRFSMETVRDCEGDKALNEPCHFFHYRMGDRPSVKIFRKFCLDCMGGSPADVRECPTETCECYPYRMGKNPALKGKRKASEKGIAALKKYRDYPRDDTKNDQKPFFLSRTKRDSERGFNEFQMSGMNHEAERVVSLVVEEEQDQRAECFVSVWTKSANPRQMEETY